MVVRKFGETMSLQSFIRRTQIINSYRALLRATRTCDDASLKADIVSQIRYEYRRHKDVKDAGLVKQYLLEANKELKKVQDLCSPTKSTFSPSSTIPTVKIHTSKGSLSNSSSSTTNGTKRNVDNDSTNDSSYYPTSTKTKQHQQHSGPSWMSTKDEEDERGRIGEGWPWER